MLMITMNVHDKKNTKNIWFGLTAYQFFMGYLIPKFYLFLMFDHKS